MIRAQFIEAREKRGWTQKELAERIGVDVSTIQRWETGNASPQGKNKWKLLEALGASSERDLNLEHHVDDHVVLNSLLRQSIIAQLLVLVFSTSGDILGLQSALKKRIEGLAMDTSRREVLITLAALPLMGFTLPIEKFADEVLRRSAAGITACEELSRGTGVEMREASKALTAYLPALKVIAKSSPSSRYRSMASTLCTQVFIRKAVLAIHLTGTKQAVVYAKQAVDYAEVCSNTALLISSLVWYAWALFSNGQMKSAMDIALQAKYLVEHTEGLSSLTCSSVHAVAAKYQALNGAKYTSEALKTLNQARNDFATAGRYNDTTMYLDHSRDVLLLVDGMVHYYSGDAVSAYGVFSQVIDPDTLESKIPISSERLRIEAINDLTLASLKLPREKKDKERSVKLWLAGLQGAITLKSEQRLSEIVTAHHIMEALWEEDQSIKELREHIIHW